MLQHFAAARRLSTLWTATSCKFLVLPNRIDFTVVWIKNLLLNAFFKNQPVYFIISVLFTVHRIKINILNLSLATP